MANVAYLDGKKSVLDGSIDLASDTLCMALLGAGYTPSDAHSAWSDVSAQEVAAGGGYASGGAVLGSKQLLEDAANRRAYFTSAAPLWPAATISAHYAVIYKRAGGSPAAGDKLLLCLDFGAAVSSTNGNYEVRPDATNGWFYI